MKRNLTLKFWLYVLLFQAFAPTQFAKAVSFDERIIFNGSGYLEIGKYDEATGFEAGKNYTWSLRSYSLEMKEEILKNISASLAKMDAVIVQQTEQNGSIELSVQFKKAGTSAELAKYLKEFGIRISKNDHSSTQKGEIPVKTEAK